MKKVLTTMVTFLALALTACGGTSNNGESKKSGADESSSAAPTTSTHTHTYDETRWGSNATQHWHPATCEHTNQKGSPANHTFVEVTAESVDPTCSQPGKKVEACSICGYKKETPLTAEHDMQAYAYDHEKAANEVASTMKKCSRDNYYEISFSAIDAAAELNVSGDKKSGGWVKLSKQVDDNTTEASYVMYRIYSPMALTGRFWIDITGNTSNYWERSTQSGNQSLFYTYDDTTTHINTWKNKVEFGTDADNLAEVDFENAKYTVDGQEIAFKELMYSDFGTLESSSSSAGKTISVPMPEVSLSAGVNILKFTRLTGYAFNMHSFTFKSNIVA